MLNGRKALSNDAVSLRCGVFGPPPLHFITLLNLLPAVRLVLCICCRLRMPTRADAVRMAVQHALLDLHRQRPVGNRAMARILEDTGVTELARSSGLCLEHNYNNFLRVDGASWDQATLCCTRYLPMTEAAADAIRLAAEQARLSRLLRSLSVAQTNQYTLGTGFC